MNKDYLISISKNFADNAEYNYVSKEIAISQSLTGMRMYETPLLGFANSNDIYFENLKKEGVIGHHFTMPNEWLPEAKTVISFFFPFTDIVKTSNGQIKDMPSSQWLHARKEGQFFINKFCEYIISEFNSEGYECIAPSLDKRFWTKKDNKTPSLTDADFTSNWSERHAAFICGLGTFGLSKGLITEKGIAGRFGSIITDAEFDVTERKYKDVYEYCTMCGACAKNCPVNAISLENGKIHNPCSTFLDMTEIKYAPRYGCGKCQVNVPCQNKIPHKK